jgi:hypothetical protein
MNVTEIDVDGDGQPEGVTRRGSLPVLAAALAAALALPSAARAGKNGKNGKKRCKQQKDQCRGAVTGYCGNLVDPQLCESVYLPCCDQFTNCNVESGIACILSAD